MDENADPVTQLRLYGLAGVVSGVVLGVLSVSVPATFLALGLFFLAPLIWFSQWKYDAVVNLGPAVAFVGLLMLLADTEVTALVDWVGPPLIAGFVIVASGLQAILAPLLVARFVPDKQ